MTMFLIQALLWLLVAFLLGYGIGRFLKPLFCREEVDRDVYGMNMLHTDTGSGEAPRSAVSATTAAVLGGGATVAAGAGLAAKAASTFDFSRIDPHKPIIDPPDLDIEFPEVSLEVPQADVDLPDVELKAPEIDLPDVEWEAPEVDLPEVSLEVPQVDVDLPEIEVKAPEIELPDVELKAPEIELPAASLDVPQVDVDLPEVEVDKGADWLDIAKGTVVAAGAGLAAKAASAFDFSKIDPHKPIIDPPDLDIEFPEVSLEVPTLDVDLPEIEVKAPEIDLPEVSLEAPTLDVDLPEIEVTAPEIDLPDVSLDVPQVDVDLSEVEVEQGTDWLDIAKGTVVAAGAGLAAKAASAFDFSNIDPHKPIIDPPDLDIDLPEAEAYLDIPQVGTDMLDAEKQALDVELEKVETEVRSLEAELLEATEATGVDLEMPMDAPDVSLASTTEAETDSSSLSGAAAAAIAAGGAALIANTVSATDGDEEAGDWLLKLVQQAKDAYHGRNPRAVSKLLHTGSDYDCSAIDQYESLTLQPATYDKLGSSHCGVPRAGFVAVGGDVSNVEQGAAVLFHSCNIVVCRDAEDNHYFIRVAG
ncbi:MAG: hypothetical protein KJ914_13765 [Gammaproteobacteria bacterium]|nr:hypothetical protein [Gammaproteobacteria bacterium]MBU1723832.1 hypothetical protein [Gammaproteobacteria bacterium]MBU2004478.1 hypothetical protein [Gammaproteobacteria bacterium]